MRKGGLRLSDLTIAGVCAFMAIIAWMLPLSMFETMYEGIDNDRVNWSCGVPLVGLAPAGVDLDDVRADLVALVETEAVEAEAAATADSTEASGTANRVDSRHPSCGALARVQVGLGVLCGAAAVWRGRRWWKSTADDRAEKKFKRLHERVGKPTSKLF